jgi:hypothetical protein
MQRFDRVQRFALSLVGAISLVNVAALSSQAAILGRYTFETNTGSFTADSDPQLTDPGITLSKLTSGSGVVLDSSDSQSGNPGRGYLSNGWTKSALPARTTDYLEFTVTPTVGATLTISQILFDSKRGSTSSNFGPRNWAIRSSFDQFSNNLGSGNLGVTNLWQPITADIVDLTEITLPISFRLYGYAGNASTVAGNFWSIDNLTIDGNVSSIITTSSLPVATVPSPSMMPGIISFGITLWRKRWKRTKQVIFGG